MQKLSMCLAAVTLVLAGIPRTARSCSCAELSPAAAVAQADAVLVARAGKNRTSGDKARQRFTVFHVLKGSARKVFDWRRPAPTGLCDPEYQGGEVTLLFVRSGGLHLCAGNAGLGEVRHLPALLKAAKAKTRTTKPHEITAAIAAGTKGYRHGRRRIPVVGAGVGTRKERLGPSVLAYVQRGGRGAIEIDRRLSAGRVTYIEGRYPREGLEFRVLIAVPPPRSKVTREPPAPEVLHVWQAER